MKKISWILVFIIFSINNANAYFLANDDTLLLFNGHRFTLLDSADNADFLIKNLDIDSLPINQSLAGSFGQASSFKYFFNYDTTSTNPLTIDTISFIGATSWFTSADTANNWFIFGPVTIPATGAKLAWKHWLPENEFRDGYTILIDSLSNQPASFNDTIVHFDDMDQQTNLNDDGFNQKTLDIPGIYNNTRSYFAIHHNAYDMYILYIDDIVIWANPLGIEHIKMQPQLFIQNPVEAALNFTCYNNISKNIKAKLFSITGEEVLNHVIQVSNKESQLITMECSSLKPGIYSLVVDNGQILKGKIIKIK